MNTSLPDSTHCRLWFDGVSLYIAAKVPTTQLAKIAIGSIALFFALPAPMLLFMQGGKALPMAVAAFAAWIFLMGRLAFWNLFGEELIILNTKSVSYQRSYGVIETKLQTYPLRNMRVEAIITKERNKIKYSKLQFYTYNEHDLPELLLESSIALPEQSIYAIFRSIDTMNMQENNSIVIWLN